jgi:hypothetical protein
LIAQATGWQEVCLIICEPKIAGVVFVLIHFSLWSVMLDISSIAGERLVFAVRALVMKQLEEVPLQFSPDIVVE